MPSNYCAVVLQDAFDRVARDMRWIDKRVRGLNGRFAAVCLITSVLLVWHETRVTALEDRVAKLEKAAKKESEEKKAE
ncbi:MAG: hypothetical protein J6T99_06130 [Oscillospiraceae bacterium]|nr:hypothetical protein [Oscillospiraceae bacterium]